MSLIKLEKSIIGCRKCDRLFDFREKIAREKRKSYKEWDYWGKAVPGYGNPNAKFMILGLAPAAHGGNRTGRVFTGDKSAHFLFRCLHHVGMASQPNSDHRDDGLELEGYITASVKCLPPGDKPTKIELNNCFGFFKKEIEHLKNLKIIVALGKIAFDACVDFYKSNYNFNKKIKFGHSKFYQLPNDILLIGSYHPSPRNVNTGRININKMTSLFKKIEKII